MSQVIKAPGELSARQRVMAVVLVFASSFLLSVSVGMNAIIIPTTLDSFGFNTSLIGLIMAIEFVSVFAISFYLPHLLRVFSLKLGMELSTLFRVPALLLLSYFVAPEWWLLLVFIHGIGNFLLGVLLQTWINSIPFVRSRGLSMAMLGLSISLGLAAGPVLLQFSAYFEAFLGPTLSLVDQWAVGLFGLVPHADFDPVVRLQLLASALVTFLAVLPVMLGRLLVPKFEISKTAGLMRIVRLAPAVMFAVAVCGVSILGTQSFITVYGLQNGMQLTDAALLLTSFMLGSIILEVPIAWLSDYFDRRYAMIVLVLLSLICAVYLPIAIYTAPLAWGLLFIWGGVIGGLFSICLALTAERFTGEDLVAANAAFSIMDNLGGIIGILLIGVSMDLFGADGLPYVVMLAGVVYFSFALTRYQVR